MIFKGFSVGSMDSNCYIIGCEETREAAVIDPGAEGAIILNRLKELQLDCRTIILTHGHADHIGALGKVREATGARVMIHSGDADMLVSPGKNLSAFMGASMKYREADVVLKDGDIIDVGKIRLKAIHTPGHTTGGISLAVENKLITGDTLFAGSVGRSDFPGGDHEQLIRSIKDKLMVFPPETEVYPGHGPSSTIKEESKYNPYINGTW